MSALDTLKATQARIIKLREDAEKSSKEADDLEREICLAIEVAQDYEDKSEEKMKISADCGKLWDAGDYCGKLWEILRRILERGFSMFTGCLERKGLRVPLS